MSKLALAGLALWVGTVGTAAARADQQLAPPINPDRPRYLPNGEVEPPRALQSNGGVGGQINPYNDAQTRSGGPSGGGNQGGGD